jgi:hypothetical protein
MKIKEAWAALEPPLIFGNEVQIKALKFLEDVEICKESLMNCKFWSKHAALSCRADEVIVAYVEGCVCVALYSDDVVVAALRKGVRDEREKYLR